MRQQTFNIILLGDYLNFYVYFYGSSEMPNKSNRSFRESCQTTIGKGKWKKAENEFKFKENLEISVLFKGNL
jgi:hypothetical protein